MDRKYKLLIASSLVSVVATGCSSFGSRGNADPQTNVTGAGVYIGQQAATTTVGDNNVQATAPNGRTQQWYIDRFNRQQAANAGGTGYVPPKPIVVKPYVAPTYTPPKPISYVAPAPATKTQTQYVDYTGGVEATITTPTNKNLYTGSYQQPNTTYQQYQPKTYTGGAGSGSTGTSANTSGAGAYVVKKGDTVFEVMRQTGVYWKEIISMNNLQAPTYTIQPGQTLRLR